MLQNKWTALHWAADRGHSDVVYLLLDSDADPCRKNMVCTYILQKYGPNKKYEYLNHSFPSVVGG